MMQAVSTGCSNDSHADIPILYTHKPCEFEALSDPATRTAADGDSQDEVFGMNDSDVNQNKNRSNKSETTSSPAPAIHPSAGQTNQAMGYWPRPHLVRLFSRDAPGREDNTFKERPSESDELHTIEEAEGATSERSSHSSSRRRTGGDNAVVHFFRSIGDQKSSVKAQKGRAGEGQGTLTRIFKMLPKAAHQG
ncbi:myelin basic protein isoform X1 [Silurus meridionalis]|nr:myelin basic protein isoform X1 [Silurus meridionalis]